MENFSSRGFKLRKIIKSLINPTIRFCRFLNCSLLLFFLRNLKSNLHITYDNRGTQDGTGAQIQRNLAVLALADAASISYLHSKILDVSVHPFDPFQDKELRSEYVLKLNHYFNPKINNYSFESNFNLEIYAKTPSFYLLFKLKIISIIRKKKILLKVVEVYSIMDKVPSYYKRLKGYYDFSNFYKEYPLDPSVAIVIHFRQGVGGMAIYHEQSTPRELPIEYFVNCLNDIVRKHGTPLNSKILVLTDAPKSDAVYVPPAEQAYLWSNTPGFINNTMHISGKDLEFLFLKFGFEVDVKSGGDPLEAISFMMQSKYLIISRSSMSYLSAILNNSNNIYYPQQFWHPKLTKWRSI